MLLVALPFLIVFLFRDVQILATRERGDLPVRLATYALFVAVAVMLLTGTGTSVSGFFYTWTERRFAIAAVLMQLLEVFIGLVLQRTALGRYSWVGYILPSPAFLIALITVASAIQDGFLHTHAASAMQLITAAWILIVSSVVAALAWADNPWEDRKFANEFALITGCTAFLFVPFGFF
jgi:hypothetical protein